MMTIMMMMMRRRKWENEPSDILDIPSEAAYVISLNRLKQAGIRS